RIAPATRKSTKIRNVTPVSPLVFSAQMTFKIASTKTPTGAKTPAAAKKTAKTLLRASSQPFSGYVS
ncbi:MAG: hypothetical protein RR022_09165, partial [Angelakisella sp.]